MLQEFFIWADINRNGRHVGKKWADVDGDQIMKAWTKYGFLSKHVCVNPQNPVVSPGNKLHFWVEI